MTNNFFYDYCKALPKNQRPNKWLHYLPIYEKHFQRFRNKNVVVLEIGLDGGHSLKMWKTYFGDQARIIGLDNRLSQKQHAMDGIEIFIGDQASPNIINTIFKKYPEIDIVIDDGGHYMNQQIQSFNLMYHKILPHGVYMVEDTHTSYMKRYGGGLENPGTFIEAVKDKVDDLTALFSQYHVDIKVSDFTMETQSINFYDSAVVFEKSPQEKRRTVKGL